MDWLRGMRSSMGIMTLRVAIVTILAGALCADGRGQDAPAVSSAIGAARFDVTGTIHISRDSSQKKPSLPSTRGPELAAVVWLQPLDPTAGDLQSPSAFKMTQKDKEFHPRLLVVPVGSTVAFPNADSYFHNVFSLYNGRRFDLGLYQSGQTRNVAFNREGVSYIFCNIHPEMSAIIISLKTPYYAQPDAKGLITLHGIPQGLYRLQVWSELASPETLRSLSRIMKVDRSNTVLGTIEIHVGPSGIEEHLNKFGQPYDTHSAEPPY